MQLKTSRQRKCLSCPTRVMQFSWKRQVVSRLQRAISRCSLFTRLMKEMGQMENDKIFPQRIERLLCGTVDFVQTNWRRKIFGFKLDPDTFDRGTIMHELMHRIGFAHEHNRPDRDTYVNILWNNIEPGWKAQYAIAQGSSLLLTYDYGSVMHYGLGSAMKTKLNTNGAVIGQRKGLSQLDIDKLKKMYCPSSGNC